MDCSAFREKFPDYDTGKAPDGMGGDYGDWADHFHDCAKCGTWALVQRCLRRGADPAEYPCIHMAYYATETCDMHPNRAECDDLLIEHRQEWDEYAIIKGQVLMLIHYCPWCGAKLPPSQRERWYREVEVKGLDRENLPVAYTTRAWFAGGE